MLDRGLRRTTQAHLLNTFRSYFVLPPSDVFVPTKYMHQLWWKWDSGKYIKTEMYICICVLVNNQTDETTDLLHKQGEMAKRVMGRMSKIMIKMMLMMINANTHTTVLIWLVIWQKKYQTFDLCERVSFYYCLLEAILRNSIKDC